MTEKKTNRVKVSFTDKELAKLKLEYMNSRFNSFSRFLNHKTTNRFFMVNKEKFSEVFSKLSRIGNDINQIAKSFNDVTIDKKELDLTPFKDLKELISDLKKVDDFILAEHK